MFFCRFGYIKITLTRITPMEKKYFIFKYKHEKYDGKVYELIQTFFDFYQEGDAEKVPIFVGVDEKGTADFFQNKDVKFVEK